MAAGSGGNYYYHSFFLSRMEEKKSHDRSVYFPDLITAADDRKAKLNIADVAMLKKNHRGQ